MRRFILLTVFLLTLAARADAVLQIYNPLYRERIEEGLSLIYSDRFDEAKNYFAEVIDDDVTDPTGYFFSALSDYLRMCDLEEPALIDSVREGFERVIDLAEFSADRGEIEWGNYIVGTSHFILSMAESQYGSKSKSISEGRAGFLACKTALDLSPENNDLKLAVGSYYFWSGRKLSWLPIVIDKSELGLSYLIDVATKSRYTRLLGYQVLVYALQESGEKDKALSYARRFSEEFPRSRAALWTLAKALLDAGKTDEAISIFDTLLAHYRKSPGNWFNVTQIRYFRLKIFLLKGDKPSACYEAKKILSLPLSDAVRERLEKELKEVEAVIKECN